MEKVKVWAFLFSFFLTVRERENFYCFKCWWCTYLWVWVHWRDYKYISAHWSWE